MKIRAYITPDDRFTHEDGRPKSPARSDGDGHLFIELCCHEPVLHSGITEDDVKYYTMIQDFQGQETRRSGIYRRGDAEITVENNTSATDTSWCGDGFDQVVTDSSLFGKGPDLQVLVELYRDIRAGTVQPDIDWDGPQVGYDSCDGPGHGVANEDNYED